MTSKTATTSNKKGTEKRKRGGQPFNKNAIKHGIYSQFPTVEMIRHLSLENAK